MLLANPGPDVHGGPVLCHTHSKGIDCTLPLAGWMWIFFPTRKARLRKSTHNQDCLLRISNQHSTLVWQEDYFPNLGSTCLGTGGLVIHAKELPHLLLLPLCHPRDSTNSSFHFFISRNKGVMITMKVRIKSPEMSQARFSSGPRLYYFIYLP